MKNTGLNIILVFCIIASTIIVFCSCKKEEDTGAKITVKYLTDSTKVAANALVKIYPDGSKLPPHTNPVIDTVKGFTDASGTFSVLFKNEAILNVSAQKDNYKGQTVITLKAGKTTSKTVLIHNP